MAQPAQVLIIDDDTAFLTALSKLLRQHGHVVAGAASPGAAMEYVTATRGQFDLIITDLSMPVLDGLRVLRILKNGFPRIPVVVLTAFGDAASETEALRAGARAFLSKPVDEPRLLALVAQAAANAR